ncbi:hypothetical protein AUO95_11565 [Corynebacterium glutamicum]|nr:hypothetical protein AUO95_11565 [Corynebacterium glutamicum]
MLYIAGEESLKFNVIPSLIAAGADMNKVLRPQVDFTLPDGEVENVALIPERDMKDLTQQCLDNDVKLIIVDPFMDFINGVDLYKSNDVRAKIKPWTELAENIDGVVIAITHLNKSGNGDVVAGINGSSAFGEVARSIFGFAKDPESEDGDRIMSQEKNSVGTEGAAWTYRIQGKEITNKAGVKGEFGTFQLIGDSDRTVGEVLREASSASNDTSSGVKSFVVKLLTESGGTMPTADVEQNVREAGYVWKTAQNQKDKWGIESRKVGAVWQWVLVGKIPDEKEDPTPRDLGILGSSKVTAIKEDPKHSRSQDPIYKKPSGSSTQDKLAEVLSFPSEDRTTQAVLNTLSPTHPRNLGAIMREVKQATGSATTVPEVLDKLEAEGRVTQPTAGNYLLKK